MKQLTKTNKEILKSRLKRREDLWIKKPETLSLKGLNQESNYV